MSIVPAGLIYYAGTQIVSALGSGMLSVTISDSATSILSMLKETVYEDYPLLKSFMEKYDIKPTIEIIEKLMNDFPEELEKKEAIKLALENVHNIIINIHTQLDNINIEIKYHENYRYFASYRTPHYGHFLKKIENLINLLDLRMKLLLKLCRMYK